MNMSGLVARAPRPGGYILIYVAGILLFMSITVMSLARSLRLDAQIGRHQQLFVQAEYRLESALEYAVAQMALANAIKAQTAAFDTKELEQIDPWDPARPKLREIVINDEPVRLLIEPGSGNPDLNLLEEPQLLRLFLVLGNASVEQTRQWVRYFLEAREMAKSIHGKGFVNIDEVLGLEGLPASIRYGGEASADGEGNDDARLPGLRDLFSLNTGVKGIDANQASLVLLSIFADAPFDKLEAFDAARRKAPLSVEDAVRLLGEPVRPYLVGEKVPVVRLLAETRAGPQTYSLAAYMRLDEKGGVQILDRRLGARRILGRNFVSPQVTL